MVWEDVHSFPSFLFSFLLFFFSRIKNTSRLVLLHHNDVASRACWWLAKTSATCKTKMYIEKPGLSKAVGGLALHSTGVQEEEVHWRMFLIRRQAFRTPPRNVSILYNLIKKSRRYNLKPKFEIFAINFITDF